ncbi:MAG: hypothetical protein N3B21_18145 [Clostridia bacterium]|nr:hypothetical protein [Clostridia bacterium]
MWIITLAIAFVIALRIEGTLKLRYKYQKFSNRFSYYIDFIALLLAFIAIYIIAYLLNLTPIPQIIVEYMLTILFIYALLIILPIKAIDEMMQRIYK